PDNSTSTMMAVAITIEPTIRPTTRRPPISILHLKDRDVLSGCVRPAPVRQFTSTVVRRWNAQSLVGGSAWRFTEPCRIAYSVQHGGPAPSPVDAPLVYRRRCVDDRQRELRNDRDLPLSRLRGHRQRTLSLDGLRADSVGSRL